MLEICFYAEKRSLEPDDLSFHRWRTICIAFGVDRCFIVDHTGMREHLTNQLDNLPCDAFIVDDFNEIDNGNPRVFVEKDVPINRTAVPYNEFTHPPDAMYCFGGDHCGMQHAWHEQETTLAGDWIHVPVEMEWAEEAVTSIWADQAAAIILAHRRVTLANS